MDPEEFVLLANGAKGAAAVSLIKQVIILSHQKCKLNVLKN